MSLMNTVTKMAIGFAMAKGMDVVQKKGGIGAVMEDLQASMTGQGGPAGGIGDMLSKLGQGQGGAAGGLQDMLGQLMGGGESAGGAQMAGMGGLGSLGGLLGGLAGARGGASPDAFEAMVNADNPPQAPDDDTLARLMLRAITQAARADGDLDADEQAKLIDALQKGDPEDMGLVREMLNTPVDAKALAADTPKGLETQVYTLSVNAIDPDNRAEAEYLHALAGGLGLSPQRVNEIHDGLGAARIYR